MIVERSAQACPERPVSDVVSYGVETLRLAARAFASGGAMELARQARLLICSAESLIDEYGVNAGRSDPTPLQAGVGRNGVGRGPGMIDADRDVDAQRRDRLIQRLRCTLPTLNRGAAQILLALIEQPDAIVTTSALMTAIGTRSGSAKIVKVYISQLRAALRVAGMDDTIITHWGQGYGLDPERAHQLQAMLRG